VLIKFDIDSDLYKQIENLIKDGKYSDVIQFIKVATTNQLQEEKAGTNSNKLQENSEVNFSEHLDIIKKIATKEQETLKKILSEISIDESEIEKNDVDFIWSFYNRFFPVKIAIFQLANSVTVDEPWIDLNEWQETAVSMAQDWYRVLKEYEIAEEIRMNGKLTVGLPTHPLELNKVKGKKMKAKLERKITSSKSRFMEQFVGRYNKKNKKFEGACFGMGLISVKITGTSSFVSLTNLGKEFALLENPIIHNKNMSYAFSDKEIKLIYKKIIPQFKAEQQIIKDVINELKNKSLTSDEIQKIFEGYKKFIFEYYSTEPEKLDTKKREEKITQSRVATMGRLSELKIVNWEIKERGISHYSLNQEKCQFLGII